MDLTHDDLVNMHIIPIKRNSTHNFFSRFNNLYGSLKKENDRKKSFISSDSVLNLLTMITIADEVRKAIITGLSLLFIKNTSLRLVYLFLNTLI